MKLAFAGPSLGPNEDDDTSPTQPIERPSFAGLRDYTSEIKVRTAMRVEHMQARRAAGR